MNVIGAGEGEVEAKSKSDDPFGEAAAVNRKKSFQLFHPARQNVTFYCAMSKNCKI